IVDVAVQKTGFSADTFLIELEGCATGVIGKRALVVRIERPGRNTFLGTSIVKQAHMMQALSNHGISVPAIEDWAANRSEERSVGKECASTEKHRWSAK